MTYLFSKKKDDLLIDMVRVNPILYDPYHDNFRNLIMKHQIWQDISSSLAIPLADVKKRWRHFRDHFVKKLKLQEAGLLRGRPWEHMRRLEFLAPSRPRQPDQERGAEELYVAPPAEARGARHAADSDEEPLTTRAEPSAKKRKHSSEHSPEAAEPPSSTAPEDRHSLQRLLQTEVEKSPVHKFFESMADIVEQFPPRLAAQARLKVCQLVTEMELQVHSEQMQWQESALRTVKRE